MKEHYLLFSTADERQARGIIKSIQDYVKNKDLVKVKEIRDLIPCSMAAKMSYADDELVWKKEDFDDFTDFPELRNNNSTFLKYRNYYLPVPVSASKFTSTSEENEALHLLSGISKETNDYTVFTSNDSKASEKILDGIKGISKIKGWVSFLDVMELIDKEKSPGTINYCGVEDESEYGWTLDMLKNLKIRYLNLEEGCSFSLPKPIELKSITDKNTILKKDEFFDPVSNPSHYTEGRIYEPRKVIADWGLNFNLGNAVKYLARAGRKGDAKIQDLRKAIQYIEFEIEEESKE